MAFVLKAPGISGERWGLNSPRLMLTKRLRKYSRVLGFISVVHTLKHEEYVAHLDAVEGGLVAPLAQEGERRGDVRQWLGEGEDLSPLWGSSSLLLLSIPL